MKRALTMSLIAIALTACVQNEVAPIPTTEANVQEVGTLPGGYKIHRVCIRSVSYLTLNRDSIIVEVDPSGKPAECRVTK